MTEQMQTARSEDQIQEILSTVRRRLEMDVGFVAEFVDARRVFRYTDPAGEICPIKPGDSDPLEDSYCHYVAQGHMPQLLPNAGEHPIAAALPVTKELPVGAHISVPIRLSSGRVFGTLCCFSAHPDTSLNDQDLEVLRICADILARIIEKTGALHAEHARREQAIVEILQARSITMVYQPIYRLKDDRLMSFEALARFPVEPRRTPDKWFSEAEVVGRGTELEFLAIEEALVALLALPRLSISFNLSPAAILCPRFAETFGPMPVDRVIVELTEHAAIESYTDLNKVLAPHRARGLRLAIDDVGSGHASLRHVIELKPDLIKLDMSMTRNVDADPTRRSLAQAITRFSRDMGCEVVAEGVETDAELESLRAIGVTKVQGHLVGRPMPLADAVELEHTRAARTAGAKAASAAAASRKGG